MPKQRKTEDRRAYMRAYNEILHTRMYRPEGRMPRDLIHEARRRCFEMGGDLSVANDMRLAIHSVWEDAEEFSLRWQWFHPEEAVIVANRLSINWRRSTQKFRDQEVARFQVECSQFEL